MAIATSMGLCAVGCGGNDNGNTVSDGFDLTSATPTNTDAYDIPQDYCRTYYEVFVRSFADSDGDGIGDIRGLINNLDYLNDGDDSTTTDLGINGIWLMPMHASPSYHGYDVTDYKSINPAYGTLSDFDDLVEACDERGIWLQMDLVLNHTSNRHKWFLDAVAEAQFGLEPSDPAAVNMHKYNFVHQATKPNDGGKWYAVSGAAGYWYLGNFSSDMPDLNLANEQVKEDIKDIVDFWLERGVRSFRLDAVPWAFSNSVSYSPENGEFWTWFNDYCDEKGREVYGDRYPGLDRYCYNVGEALTSSQSTISDFYSTGMSNFNYVMGGSRNVGFSNAIVGTNASAYAVVQKLENLQKDFTARDSNALLSNFLSNHDNDRSVGYMGYDQKKIKMLASLYLLAPGNPYIYYGEEIGASGSRQSDTDADRRLHFNWGNDQETQDPPGAKYKDNLKFGTQLAQTNDKDSILTHYRQVIKLRNRFPEIGRGAIATYALNADNKLVPASEVAGSGSATTVNAKNKTVAAYTLAYKGSTLLILQNIGEDTVASIDLGNFEGYQIVGAVKADGGSVTLSSGKLSISSGIAAVLKLK